MDNRDYQPGEGDDAEHRAGRVSAPGGGVEWREPDSYTGGANYCHRYPVFYIYRDWHFYSRGDGHTYVYTIEYSDAQPYVGTNAKRDALAI